ncbi:M20/M25/M40 family metallo-hydrolase [Vulcanisaeta distributa]|uniref:M20/M25/M40 family metallo-hydrolase n=1 Tax=Vulcanisaeta distributa TaxID=164451 RepID=UPI000AADB404|nr:M20/M25/M40 family metallo-hydrolase [Vulcanisaeta distributa]
MRWCTEPVEVSINNTSARAVSRAIIKVLGKGPTPPARKWGTSDMNDLALLTKNMVAYGPGDGAYSHSFEEYIFVEDYLRAIDIYKQAIVEFMNIYK